MTTEERQGKINYYIKTTDNGGILDVDENYNNILHDLAAGKKKAKILLPKLDEIKAEDLNLYNIKGRTPFLTALLCKNFGYALKLLESPNLNVNLPLIYLLHKPNWYSRYNNLLTMSIIELVDTLRFNSEIQQQLISKIKSHPQYKSDYRPVRLNSISLREAKNYCKEDWYAFAFQADPDTFKTLLSIHGKSLFKFQREYNTTLLHLASEAPNIPLLKFLLDKKQIDSILGDNSLTEKEYTNFVNHHRTTKKDSPVELNLNVTDLFIQCSYYDINKLIKGNNIVHKYVKEGRLESLMELIYTRGKEIDFTKNNCEGKNPLELACVEGQYEIVELLAKASNFKLIEINPNPNRQKLILHKYMKRFSSFIKRNLHIPFINNCTNANLISAYYNQEPCEIEIRYEKIESNLNITFSPKDRTLDSTLKEKITKYINYCCDYEFTIDFFNKFYKRCPISLADCLIPPDFANDSVYKKIKSLVKEVLFSDYKSEDYAADSMDSEVYLNEDTCKTINYNTYLDIEIQAKIKRKVNVIEEGVVSNKQLRKMVSLYYQKLGKKLPSKIDIELESSFQHSLFTVAKMLSSRRNNIKYLKTIKALLLFPNLELNEIPTNKDTLIPLAKYLTLRIQKLREILNHKEGDAIREKSINLCDEILQVLKKKGKIVSNVNDDKHSDNKDTNNKHANKIARLNKKLLELSDHNEFLNEFVGELWYFNYSRESFDLPKEDRRLDSLARIMEGYGVCTAVALHNGQLLISSNKSMQKDKKNKLGQRQQKHKDIIEEIIEYFKNSDFGYKELRSLIAQAAFAKSNANNLIKKAEDKKKLVRAMHKYYKTYNGEVKEFRSTDEIVDILKIYGYSIELPKITADGIKITKEDKKKSEDDNKAKYINLSNNIIKMISDIKKLESYLNKDEGKVLKEAIDNFSFDQHFITDEVTDIHAEMRIVNYIFAQENKTKNEASNDKYYVGISKLSCVHCNMILGALGKNNPQQWHQAMRGYHGRGFDWKLPDFYLNKFEDIFSHNKKLVNLFKKAKEQDEQFLKEIIINAESLFNANCRLNSKNNELNADYSSSVPTLVTQAGFDSDITSPTSPAASDAPWQNSLQSNKNNGILFAMT